MIREKFNVLSHVIVNEKYKVLFCYIPKISCSNMKRIFLVMENLYPSIETADSPTMHREIVRLSRYRHEKREYMLKHFYKFLLVRDPFERLVSAYRNKLEGSRGKSFFPSMSKNIIAKYRYNGAKILPGQDYNVTFTEFVRYLIDNPPWSVNEHWMPYVDLCRPCNIQYDFIGSIDTLQRDVKHAMRKIHANETKYYVFKSKGSPLTKTKQATAGFLKELPRKYFDQILAIFKQDHELFGYPLPEYETLDKRYPAA